MQHSDFHIGLTFWSADRPHFQWRCTDIGTRTIIAMQIDGDVPSFFDGEPRTYVEHVFNEDALAACTLERVIDPPKGNWPARYHTPALEEPDSSPDEEGMDHADELN